MRYRCIAASELDAALDDAWLDARRCNPRLASPYFHPGFTRCVATVRRDAYVCVIEDEGRAVGFFPFHRLRGGIGRPIGLGLSDYHGVVAAPSLAWSARELLEASRLVRWEFDHLVDGQAPLDHARDGTEPSPIIELHSGFEAFLQGRDKAGRKQLREIARRRERLEQTAGIVEFLADDPDPAALERVISWKSEQCRRTSAVDFFARRWCSELARSIRDHSDEQFGARVCSLRVDGRIIAVHYVMHAGREWHSWFPAYDPEFSDYSPGLILLVEMVSWAAGHGVGCIDLGKDAALYKRRFQTGERRVAHGVVTRPSLANVLIGWRDRTVSRARASALAPVLRWPGRLVLRVFRGRRYG